MTHRMHRVEALIGVFRHEPVFAAAGWLFALSLVVTVPALLVDTRTFQGENVWIKPIKFQVALAVYLLTLAAYACWMPTALRNSTRWKVFAMLVVFACLFEIAVIGGAAMHATASHYNTDSPQMMMLYSLMGVFAIILTSASLVCGIVIWRNRDTTLPAALQLSIGLGLVLTFVLTLPVAGTLSSQPGHFVGIPETGAVVPIMGWSREVGDLRIAHFFATHAMHFLPLAGVFAVAWFDRHRAQRVVQGTAVALCLLVGFTFVLALMGLPLVPIPG